MELNDPKIKLSYFPFGQVWIADRENWKKKKLLCIVGSFH